jgi:hypothetical protein
MIAESHFKCSVAYFAANGVRMLEKLLNNSSATCDRLKYFKRPWPPDPDDGRYDHKPIRFTIVGLTLTGTPEGGCIRRVLDANDMLMACQTALVSC